MPLKRKQLRFADLGTIAGAYRTGAAVRGCCRLIGFTTAAYPLRVLHRCRAMGSPALYMS